MNIFKDRFKLYLFLTVVGYLALFINVNHYEFRNEESLRTIIAYEMDKEGSLIQPKFLGDDYYLKPPLFNWFIILSSKLIPWSEFTARFVTILFLGLTLVLIYIFSYKLLKDRTIAILSSLIYLTFLDIYFWYGFLAEIDVTLAFFILLMFYFEILGFLKKNNTYILLSGIVVGIAFLLKGFPSFVFYGLTFIGLVIYTRRWREFLNPIWYVSTSLAILIPLTWILKTKSPEIYVQKLFFESVVRAKGSTDISKFIKHLITYPLLNIKQTLPTSLFVIIGLFIAKRKNKKIKLPKEIKILLIVALINYLPYLLAADSRGRYIVPILTIVAIVFAYIINQIKIKAFQRAFITVITIFIVLRILLGAIGFEILMKYKESRKAIAKDIIYRIDLDRDIAFDCGSEKGIALYIDFQKGEAIKKSKYTPNWDYIILCDKRNIKGRPIKIYKLKSGKEIKLYERR